MGKVKIPDMHKVKFPAVHPVGRRAKALIAFRTAERNHRASTVVLQGLAREVQRVTDLLTDAVVKQREAITRYNETNRELRAAAEKAFGPQ